MTASHCTRSATARHRSSWQPRSPRRLRQPGCTNCARGCQTAVIRPSMAKVKALKAARTVYVCQACGHVETKWLGRCPACREWSSLVEEVRGAEPRGRVRWAWRMAARRSRSPRSASTSVGRGGRAGSASSIACSAAAWSPARIVLLGGDPGVGKSTLLVQALAGLARGGDVLYATGEESVAQTAMRARRVGAALRGALDRRRDRRRTDPGARARAAQPAVLAVDSIQTVYTPLLDSIPGSLAQVRECASRLMQFAKTTGTPTILVGHVTKDGALAGPKTLEHLVDVVLQLEGDGGAVPDPARAQESVRLDAGDRRVRDARRAAWPRSRIRRRTCSPSGRSARRARSWSRRRMARGRCSSRSRRWSRRRARGSAGAPRSASIGNRVSLLLAVLAQRAGCDVLDRDVFVNVAGGVRLAEPAIDLGIACAIASSARGRAIDAHTVVFGEVGLAGEIRAVHAVRAAARRGRAARLQRAICRRRTRRASSPRTPELVPSTGCDGARRAGDARTDARADARRRGARS